MDKYAHILNRNGINKIHNQLKKNGTPFLPEYTDNVAHKIINIVCDHYKTNTEDVTNSNNRFAKVIMSKYISMYIIKQDYPHIKDHMVASLFNNDRTTLIYAVKKIRDLIEFDKFVSSDYDKIRKKINTLYKL
tara:strand:+ start:156 stop:554 length:399 start_codon:yes stop_codon:yes gene_type:complete